MNKHFLKSLRDSIPEPLKYITAPLFRDQLITNKEFLHYYNLLLKRESLTAEKIKEYQFIHLKQILIHSFTTVP